jgi:16S rRNA (cytidine1402-2'-O)-methyltransferase
MSDAPRRGCLFVVATPIGHLGDLSSRARECLATCDLVVAEDTRRTGLLLARQGVERPLESCHRFAEASRLERWRERLGRGERLALVSDGGTPTVADPGHRLVAAAHDLGAQVVPVPGPSGVVAALSVSGLPADRFTFAGFLPSRRAARRREIEALARRPETLVVYEAPHRLAASLADLAELLGPRPATLCRELTKRHEEVRAGPLDELAAEVARRERVRGEIALVIAGTGGRDGNSPRPDPELKAAYARALEREEGDPRRALRRLALETGLPRAELRRRLATLVD